LRDVLGIGLPLESARRKPRVRRGFLDQEQDRANG
jgi:hypothetical protein